MADDRDGPDEQATVVLIRPSAEEGARSRGAAFLLRTTVVL